MLLRFVFLQIGAALIRFIFETTNDTLPEDPYE